MLTADRARELLDYDAETGVLTWKVYRRGHCVIGTRAGCLHVRVNGYSRRTIRVDGKLYQEHRVIWLIVTGEWPKHQIDHINHIGSDNRWINMRDVTHDCNCRNLSKSKLNRTGVTGVVWKPRACKFEARIKVRGLFVYLGSFDQIDDAAQARGLAELRFGYHKNHGR